MYLVAFVTLCVVGVKVSLLKETATPGPICFISTFVAVYLISV